MVKQWLLNTVIFLLVLPIIVLIIDLWSALMIGFPLFFRAWTPWDIEAAFWLLIVALFFGLYKTWSKKQ